MKFALTFSYFIINLIFLMASKELKEVKVLRPWVKYGLAGFAITTGYIVFTYYVYKPKPYVIEFDL